MPVQLRAVSLTQFPAMQCRQYLSASPVILPSHNPRCRYTRQFPDLRSQPRRFGLRFRQFRIERGDSLCRHGIEQTGLFLHQLREIVLGAFAQRGEVALVPLNRA